MKKEIDVSMNMPSCIPFVIPRHIKQICATGLQLYDFLKNIELLKQSEVLSRKRLFNDNLFILIAP